MTQLTADYIQTPEGLQTDHLITIDDTGLIEEVRAITIADQPVYHPGILSPGFINAHCHLELSALKGKIARNTGMTGFISEIFKLRNAVTEPEQLEAAKTAMKEVWDAGTVAVGDICNGPLTAGLKKEFPQLFTYSYLELLGLDSNRADVIIEQATTWITQFHDLSHSLTLHAPYSVSESLRDKVYAHGMSPLSVHLLESKAEKELFAQGTGPFINFYSQFQLPYEGFKARSPSEYMLNGLPSERPVLWVHCTEITAEELGELLRFSSNAYVCLCPRSNEYIHQTFPAIDKYIPYSSRICLGTDSLASNDSLDVFEEARSIHLRFPQIPLHILLTWLTSNGAKALGESRNLGKFVRGTRPGINLISNFDESEMRLTEKTQVRKLV